jgi:hypothetical protein
LNSLTITNGGRAFVQAATLRVKSFTTEGDGTLNLFNNPMIVDYDSGSPRGTIQSLINSARAGGAWTGSGITSYNAFIANPKNTTLAALEASEFKSIYGPAAFFNGESIDNTAVLIKYTYYGDANFNGQVDGGDYARIDTTFNKEHTSGNIGGWVNGDFNGDGKVDGSDYGLIDAAFNSQGAVLSSVLPPIGRQRADSRARKN